MLQAARIVLWAHALPTSGSLMMLRWAIWHRAFMRS